MVKNLLKTNLVSIIMLVAIIVVYFVVNILPLSLVLLAVWLGYTLWSNFSLIFESQKPNDLGKLVKSNIKYNVFFDDCMIINDCSKMADERLKILDDLDVIQEEILKVADKIKQQLDNNVDSAILYVKSYDYSLKPETKYIKKIRKNSEMLYSKLNELIELVLENEKSTDDIDLSSVDDILESLKEVSEL